MSRPTDDQITELCILTTRDSSGRHFTEWSKHYDQLEEMGLVKIHRPVHAATGMDYDCSHWTVAVTDAGIAVVETNPELHPSI